MKTNEIKDFARVTSGSARRGRRDADGPHFGAALLGVICAFGVFGVLTLLYHFG